MNGLDASRSAALRFLQTVVVVDDHAYTVVEEAVESASLGDESIDDEYESIDAPEALDDLADPQEFHTEVVVEAFADLGISCAVLAPDPGEHEADMQRMEKLARRSDIVILDWVLNPRDRTGSTPNVVDQTSLGFIREILREDNAGGGRVRLICVYTGSADAEAILDKISAALGEELEGGAATRSGHTIDLGSTRVVVLGKERQVPVGTIESVPSKDLPTRVVDEFAGFAAKGMLREIALDSLATVRSESHRLLRRFNGELDPALISHRSATSPADAEQFARNLVGTELGAIVLTAESAEVLTDERVNGYVDDSLAGRETAYYWKTLDGADPAQFPVDVAGKALKLGIDENERIRETDRKLPPRISRTPLLLAGEKEQVRAVAKRIDSRFSMLSSLARDPEFEGQGSPPPVLQLGAIVSNKVVSVDSSEASAEPDMRAAQDAPVEEIRYWVCLQPLCDSVRLTESTRFPLLPLKNGRSNFNYVVEQGGDHITLEHAGLKISEMELVRFAPDPSLLTVRARWNGDRWVFDSQAGESYDWKGSLRLDKAHKLLQSVVTVAGRIGIDEYEYLRGAAR